MKFVRTADFKSIQQDIDQRFHSLYKFSDMILQPFGGEVSIFLDTLAILEPKQLFTGNNKEKEKFCQYSIV